MNKPNEKTGSPRLLLRLLDLVTNESNRRAVAGDFAEIYDSLKNRYGKDKARRWLWMEIVRSFPDLIKNTIYWRMAMFKNSFKIASRNILKQKGYSFINIAGLAVGLACCLLITLWILDELSYDKFHADYGRIFNVAAQQGNEATPNLLAPALVDQIPDIEYATRYDWMSAALVSSGSDTSFESVTAVDPSFFSVFTFPLIKGDASSALNDINSIVLAEDVANRFFPNGDAIGRFLTFNNDQEMKVTGVIKNVPHNSSLQFDMLVPFEYKVQFHRDRNEDYASWGWWSTTTYFKAHKGTAIEILNEKINDIMKKNQDDHKSNVEIIPISKIHSYYSNIKNYIYSFSIIAAVVLFMACINFVNLSVARSTHRARETGIRKVSGASRINLLGQFLGESIMLLFAGLLIALGMLDIILPTFNEKMGLELSMNLLLGSYIMPILLGFALFTGIAAGLYPAFYLSAFQPVAVLRGNLSSGLGGSKLRKSLLVIQFAASIALIIGTFIIFNQLNYIRNKDVGYDKEQVVHVYLSGDNIKNYNHFKNELMRNREILAVSGSAAGMPYWRWTTEHVNWPGKNPNAEGTSVAINMVDFDFTETYGIDIVEGRTFDRNIASDSALGYLVNEEMVKYMGLKSAVGAGLNIWDRPGQIIGVMKDFHFRPLTSSIQPLAFIINQDKIGVVAIRVAAGDISSSLDYIKDTWQNIFPGFPISYAFLDEQFDRQYDRIEKIGDLTGGFSLLAIFIACLGLFGLASFSADQKTKEIGIRKVLGASVLNIIGLISREFVILVLIANMIAWPLAWLAMNKWLEEFAYRIKIDTGVFILAGGIALTITLITVGYHAAAAAMANPVKSLKNE